MTDGAIRPDTTVAYGRTSPNQVLDLYLPEPAAGPRPVVVALHGGAFRLGNRTWELGALPALLRAGWAVASVEYRLSSEARFPAAVQDVTQAVALLKARAQEWSLDKDLVVAWGRSAGGYLATMLGVTGGRRTEFGPSGDDASVAGVVAWDAPSDFLVMDRQTAEHPPEGGDGPVQGHDASDSPESRFLGAPIQEVPDIAARANPMSYLGSAPSLPPFFLAVGTGDRLIPHQQTLALAEALRAHGAAVTLEVIEGALHADPAFELPLTGAVLTWLEGLRSGR